jgi:nucleoside-diphosphate-sugar epimerase
MAGLDGRRVLLIGGAGFIGHHLALALAQRGAAVRIIDSLQVNNLHALLGTPPDTPHRERDFRILGERLDLLERAGIPLHVLDARDTEALAALVAELRPQSVVHLAAISHAGKSNQDPLRALDFNLGTLGKALEAARSVAEHFVYFSSSMVYGNFPDGRATEESPCNPIGIYGALKYAGEKMVIAYNQVFGLPYTIVRPAALYGERCVSRRVGQVFIENALDGREITVAGNGSDALDFTYVGDLVDGVMGVLEHEAARGQVLNLAYGRARALDEMVNILRGEVPGLEVRYLPKDALMPDRGTLAIDKAARLIGFAPRVPLEEGYARYIDWYRTLLTSPQEAAEPEAVPALTAGG